MTITQINGNGTNGHSRNAGIPPAQLSPHSIEAEQAVLGSMLIEAAAISAAAEVLKPLDFYRPGHQALFDVILALQSRGREADIVTVPEELTRRAILEQVGGLEYVLALFGKVGTAANVAHYADIVRRQAVLRRLLEAGLRIQSLALSAPEEESDALDAAEKELFAVSRDVSTSGGLRPLSDALHAVYTEAEERDANPGQGPVGIGTGFPELDRVLGGGLQTTDLVLLAARPSMGKSACVLAMAKYAAAQGQPVALFSLEMSARQIAQRLLCSTASVDSNALRNGHLNSLEWERLADAARDLADPPLSVDDARDASVLSIRAKCRRMLADGGLSLVIVDYLQNLVGGGKAENRNLEIDATCRQLRALAQELSVPIVLLSQLSRAVESRENKRPMLSDLRDSGAIEGHADVVLFLYNESYYKRDRTHLRDEFGQPLPEEVEIITAKNRNGPTETVKVGFVRPFARFEPLPVMPEKTPF